MKRLISLIITLIMTLSCMMSFQIPSFSQGETSLVISPADGQTVYAGKDITFCAKVPKDSVAVAFSLDGKDMGTPVTDDGENYKITLDSSILTDSEHTFKVDAALGEDVITKTSEFNLYSYENTVVYNDFQFKGTTATEADIQACEANDSSPAIWSLGTSCSAGSDETGNKWLHFEQHLSSAGYPEIRIGLNKQFFGYDVVGANSGISEGVVTTEFDIKMNLASGMTLNGSGAHGTTFSSYYGTTNVWRLFNSNGTLGNSSKTYTHGENAKWGHVKIVTDYTNNIWAYYYNDELIYHDTRALSPYGIINQWDMYGLKLQCYGTDVSYDLDNFRISHKLTNPIGFADFKNVEFKDSEYSGGVGRVDHMFTPRCYGFLSDSATSDFNLSEGTDGGTDKALRVCPNTAEYPNWRIYFQNKPYGNSSTGVLKASFDIYFEEFYKVNLSDGFGFSFGTEIFSATGNAGNLTYEKNKWYKVEVLTDMDNKKAYVFLDGILISEPEITANILTREFFQFTIFGNNKAEDKGVRLDNISFEYINLPKLKKAAEVTSDSSLLPVSFTSPFTSIKKEDVKVKVNGEDVNVLSLSQSGADITVGISKAVGTDSTIDMTILSSALTGSVTPLTKDYSFTYKVAENVGFNPIELTYTGGVATAHVTGYFDAATLSYDLYLAAYDFGGSGSYELTRIEKTPITPTPGENLSEKAELSSLKENDRILKAFLWNENMVPIDKQTLEINTDVSGETIIADVLSHSGQNVHPRLMLTENDFTRIKTVDDTVYKKGIDGLIAANRSKLSKNSDGTYVVPLCEYEIADGIRLLPVSREMLSRVTSLAMTYKLTGNDAYAERCYAELANAASFPDWNPKHFLDVGEMCNAFAIGYDWIYDWMSESQREVLYTAMVEKGLRQAMQDYTDAERYRTYKWYQANPGNNWKFVCNGGVSNAALAIFDEEGVDKELCADVLGYAFEDVYKAARNLYLEDGSFIEGFTYWTYASNYFAYYTSALRTSTGKDYGLTMYDPIKESVYYVKNISSNRFISFNFGDAVETNLCNPVILWFGKTYRAYDISALRADYIRPAGVTPNPMDLLWYNHEEYESPLGSNLYYGREGGREASFRSSWDKNALYGAIHYGDNEGSHNQSDTGVFVIEYGGKRFFNDLGQDNYNVNDYTKAYRYRTEGHNTIIMKSRFYPTYGNQSTDSVCRIQRFEGSDAGDSFAIADISAAYGGKGLVRGMKLTADKKAIIIQDELTPGALYEGYWFGHTTADITLSDDAKSAVLDIDGVKMWVGILTGQTFSVMDAIQLSSSMIQEGQIDNSQFKKLAIKFTGNTDISVAIMPLGNGENAPSSIPEFKKLSEW
ncbi:MAG: hypothetical protein E7394_01190 [Ruminococcaceae bacterium]|nr:hypothetical protein [Oscillospiraceae bacterium]